MRMNIIKNILSSNFLASMNYYKKESISEICLWKYKIEERETPKTKR